MKILYVLKSFPTGSGIDSVTRILGNEFVKRGYNVFVCCFLCSKNTVFVDSNIKIHEFPEPWEKADSKSNISFLNQIISENSIDVIINQEADVYNVCDLCNEARKGSRAKLISCLHFSLFMNMESKGCFITRFLPKKLVMGRRVKLQLKRRNYAYDNSDMFVMLSDRFAEQYKKSVPNKNFNRLRSISETINYENHNIDFSKKLKQLLVVSRIEENQKRISIIIEIWKLICNNYKDWNLIIIGDGPDMEKSKKLAENLPRIDFKGWQKPLSYYLDSSVFLMTSSFEGFGITLVEAQNYGCVPIAMDSFLALHDIITNGKNGFIVPNNDINAFAEKVCLLMNNANLREKIAENAITDCKKFDVLEIAKKWENLFMELRA